MIFARDKGRLCNNILQYGHVYAWAREHGRRSVSMRFCYKYQWFALCYTPWHHFPTYLFAKYAAKWGLLPVAAFHEDTDCTAALHTLETSKNVVVEGWEVRFYDLFLKYRKDIIGLFAFKPSIAEKSKSYMESCESGRPLRLGVHVRRGDYKTWHGGMFYYEDLVYIDLIHQFATLHSGKPLVVYVCGNDPQLDRQAYVAALEGIDVAFPQGNPAEDLCILSECDYLIGAPSTFTLVAAMYRDIPLYWVERASAPLEDSSFKHFDYLFRHIK